MICFFLIFKKCLSWLNKGLDRFCDPICLSNITNDNKIVTNNCGIKRKINPSFEEVLCNKNLSNKFNASKAEESIVEFDEKDKLITSKKCVDFVWQPILKVSFFLIL